MVNRAARTSPSVDALKDLFAHIPTSVAVVTVGGRAGAYGLTVGTLNTLSLEPPLVMFAVNAASRLLPRLHTGAAIGINLLAAGQTDIARQFATAAIDRFDGIRWCEEYALPRIDDTMAWIPARVQQRIPLGDHRLITASVASGETNHSLPLLHWRRAFHAPSPVAAPDGQSRPDA